MAYQDIAFTPVGSVYTKTDENTALAVWLKGFNVIVDVKIVAGATGSSTAFVFTPRY